MGSKHTGRSGLHHAGAAAVLAAALITTGCAAGRHSQTAYQRPTLDGTQANVGDIALRAITVEPPAATTFYAKGTAAPVRLVIVNSGESADRLTSITSPSFTGWGSFSDPSAAQTVLGSTTARTGNAIGGARQVVVPAGRRVSWGTPETKALLLITSFVKPAYPGGIVAMTFTFEKAGSVTVQVPVGLTNGPNESVVPSATGGNG